MYLACRPATHSKNSCIQYQTYYIQKEETKDRKVTRNIKRNKKTKSGSTLCHSFNQDM